MRICLVTLDFPPNRSSGLTIYAEQLARQLAERNHEVSVVAAARPERAAREAIPLPATVRIVRVPVGHADWIGLGWEAARYVATHRSEFDVVHFADIHFAYAYRGLFVASAWQSFRQRLSSRGGRPYHTSRGNYVFRLTYYTLARHLLEARSVRVAHHVVMPSRATQTEFVEHYGLDPARTTLIYPGLDLSRFRSLPGRSAARARLGLPAGAPVLLYVGFSTPRKGVEYLAAAMRSVDPAAQLLMVGSWEAGYRERFETALGSELGRTGILGYIPEEEILDCYAAADLLVLPSLLEGLGFPPVEAMAAGIPVVISRGGASEEAIGPAGLAVTPGDSRALSAAINRLIADPSLRTKLGDIGRMRAFQMFDSTRAAEKLESIYLSMTAGSKDPRLVREMS